MTLFMLILSLFYMVVLTIVYFGKKHIKSKEILIFNKLIIMNLIGLIIEIFCKITCMYLTTESFITLIFAKIYMLYIIWFSIIMTYYVYYISNNEQLLSKKKHKVLFIIGTLSAFLVSIGTIFFEVDFTSATSDYCTGTAVNLVYGYCSVLICFCMIEMLTHLKNVKSKKCLPLFVFFVGMTAGAIIQKYYPQITITTIVESFVLFIMYFTIENPDVKMIAQLNEAKAQAEKANNAKSEFLSSMSHEIRTPLNAIVGFSQALSEEDLSDEAREEVRDIISASNTLLEIVNGILDISKIEANKLEIINKEYNFKDIFDELVALTKGRLGEKPLEFKYIYDESIPSVLYGDHVRVKQIILNLLTNSVKYTKEGSITFTVNSVKKDDVIRLIVSVEDTGIGIKEENIGKLFTKFERFDEKNTTIEGTGLGLAITKQLVELMNGKIVVQSVYGKGSKFTVALDQKIVHGKVIESKDNNEDVVEFDLTGKKVLIVDDNNLNLKVASRLIKNYKCDITTVTSGIECLDKINNKEVFDLILMDDMMPRMSGGETLIRLKKIEGFNIPVVALTANAVTGMKEKYLQQGFDDYLAKPIEKGELNRVLHKFLKED